MAKYEKWLGAGIGLITGGPMGGLLGYAAGKSMEPESKKYQNTAHTSEFETNLIVLAAAVIKADGKVSADEINFIEEFFRINFAPEYVDEKMSILEHCLQRRYEARKACDGIRAATSLSTRLQIVNFLFDLALCDGAMTTKESDLIFILAGWLNVNDIQFRKIKASFAVAVHQSHYTLLGVRPTTPFEEIKTAYRKLVLEYHPDRNAALPAAQQKTLAEKFRTIQQAFQKIKEERGIGG